MGAMTTFNSQHVLQAESRSVVASKLPFRWSALLPCILAFQFLIPTCRADLQVNKRKDVVILMDGKKIESLEQLLEAKKVDDIDDPWGNKYIFERTSENSMGMTITSLGADGVPGGEGANADLIFPKPKDQ